MAYRNEIAEQCYMKISSDKMKVLAFKRKNTRRVIIAVNNKRIEQILNFNYLCFNVVYNTSM